MRQILVKENALLRALSGDTIEFAAKEFRAVALGPKVQMLRCPFAVDVVSGGALKLKFELPKHLAELGVILHGAYWENDEITLAMSTLGDLAITLDKDAALVVGSIYETARYRQVRSESTVPTKRSKRKGK